ncbi:NADPH-dependent oxidoreductase [Eggerthellaceae bacterium zg-1084]|uniref:NADPH-dependent oxidoreductase n=1 Tax=Berryella wangjianweii TaxID=2734634 RepID=UPI0015535706|nr:NADPH-dependent oxidoreductase [Berryella wangjianweii]NPD30471.1 NADPH-dependent oxidoreductase [Berryella wangjianweii]
MNFTIDHQLAHRSVRAFQNRPLSDDELGTLLAVARQTATSMGMQCSGIVRVTDQALKDRLAAIGCQKSLALTPEVWVFIVDTARNRAILDERAASSAVPESLGAFLDGFTDACLMAQNVVNAAESMGLGTVYYGCINCDAQAVIDALKLPALTFPVVGLGIGHPAQDPAKKPRMPMELRVSENAYERPESWSEALKGYDAEVAAYYGTRNEGRDRETFTSQVVAMQSDFWGKRSEVAQVIARQGFGSDAS